MAERPFAIVTGGSSGIGLALARRLAARGYELALLARGAERVQRAAASLGPDVVAVVCDVADDDAVAAYASGLRAGGRTRVDLLVCNAGISGRSSALNVEPAQARRVMDVNYHGMLGITRRLWPELVAAQGTVVNVCSVAGTVPAARTAPYSASKHAALAWSRALAPAARQVGVRVLTVNPGPVATAGFPQDRLTVRRLARHVVITDDACAEAIMRGLDRGRGEIFVPGFWRVAAIAHAVAPGLIGRIALRAWGRASSERRH